MPDINIKNKIHDGDILIDGSVPLGVSKDEIATSIRNNNYSFAFIDSQQGAFNE